MSTPIVVECYVLYSHTNHPWSLTSKITNQVINITPPCDGGHVCDRTNFMPQMVFNVNNTSQILTINASKSVDVNNLTETTSNEPLPSLIGYDARYDRLDYCTFTIVPTTDVLTNASIKLDCLVPANNCHNSITAVILILDGNIIFNACVNPNGDPVLIPVNPIDPTPTPIPSVTPTLTPTRTSTITPTKTVSITPTRTKTPTRTVTPTPTKTVTRTKSLTPTPKDKLFSDCDGVCSTTRIPCPTPTPTETPIYRPQKIQSDADMCAPAITRTVTKTPTKTVTRTITPTVTRTKTPTTTRTVTPTISVTKTKTPTPSVTRTNTPTVSITKTITRTPSKTPTITPTRTITPTPTQLCCNWDGNGFIKLDSCLDNNPISVQFVLISPNYWEASGSLPCGDYFAAWVACNTGAPAVHPCGNKWAFGIYLPCAGLNGPILTSDESCGCNYPPIWSINADFSNCDCCPPPTPTPTPAYSISGNFSQSLSSCQRIDVVATITNTSNTPAQLIMSGNAADEVIINGSIYEAGMYPFPWSSYGSPCGSVDGDNGNHAYSYTTILQPGESLTVGGKDNGYLGSIDGSWTLSSQTPF